MRETATRRGVLAGTVSVAASVTGCLGRAGDGVSVLAAGSLQNALADGLDRTTDAAVAVEAHGSRHAARLVAEGQRDPDILALSDTALFDDPLSTPWHATFVGNAVVVAYDPDSEAGRRVPEADRWFEPLTAQSARLGRTDPTLDPLGYRTLLAVRLTQRRDDEPGLGDRLLDGDQIYPETQLLSQFETGSVDAAVVYRNMAVERGYPFVELSDRVDLSDPALADHYATASVELRDGTTVEGRPIAFGATGRNDREATRSVFETLVRSTDDYLNRGFVHRDAYPAYHGDVPTGITN